MAETNIDNLNFKVILDDEKFDEKINRDIELAKQLNVQLSALLNVKSKVATSKMVGDATKAAKFQKATADAAAAQERLKTASTNTAAAQERLAAATANAANAQERLKQSQMRTEQLAKRITAQTERQNKAYTQQSRILNELKGLALGYLSIHGAGQLLSSLVRVTGEFELQKTTLAAMLGDLNAAEGVITRIQGLAVESPFQFKELTTYAKQLSAFSVPAQELYDTTKMLADISAGLGVGMDRIVLAYGQVRSAAFLRGQEVRQFTEAGIPILDELAKQFSELEGRAVSTTEVFDKISKRLVPFEMVAKVFKDMTSEGGKFYNMQEVQAETLRGKISNLKDAYEVMLNEIGKGQSENLKGAVDWARRLMQNYEETGRTLVELVAAYGVYKAALLSVTLATGTFNKANHTLINSLSNIGRWIGKNPYVAIAAGLTTALYGVYKATAGLQGYQEIQRSVNESISKYNIESAKEVANLDALYAKLNMAAKGSEEYDKARKSIYTEYASYISQLKEEGVAVDNLAAIYGNLKTKIEESVRARFRNTEAQSITQTYEREMDTIYKRFEHLVTRYQRMAKRELTYDEKEGLWQYILGNEEAWKRAEVEGLRNIVNADKYNQHQVALIKKNVQDIVSAYQEGKEKLKDVLGEDTTETTTVTNPFVYNLEEISKGKSPAQKAIEEQIRSVQKLQDAYEKLMPYLNEVQMKSTLKSLFPNIEAGVIDSLDFDAELTRLADKLEKFDEDAAQRLRDTVSKDVAGSIADSFRAVEQYKKMMDSWLGEDFNLSGEGVAFDISKIIRDLNSQYANIEKKRIKALEMLKKAEQGDAESLAVVRMALGEEVWNQYLEKGEKVIDQLATKEKQSARDVANEKIRDKANSYMKELLEGKNINLTDLADKSASQLSTLIERIRGLQEELQAEMGRLAAEMFKGDFDDEQMAQFEMLAKVVEMLGLKIEDVGVELEKSLFEQMADGVEIIASMADEITNLGDAMDNLSVAEFGEKISKMANQIADVLPKVQQLEEILKSEDALSDDGKITKKFKDLSDSAKGGIVGLAAWAASALISNVADIIATTTERQIALNDATREYNGLLIDARRNAYEGLFGTDNMALAAENQKILAEAQKSYQEALDKFENDKKIRRNKYNGSILFSKQSTSDILGDIADAQGWELYRENGELNMDALIAYYDAYSEHLTKQQKEMIDAVIEGYKAQEDAAAQSAQYLTELFGGVANTIADNMVAAFMKSGDAAIDMKSVVSDVAAKMASDLIKTLYIMPILADYAAQLQSISANDQMTADEKTEASLGVFRQALSEIEAQSDAINSTLGELEEYFETSDDAGTTDLGQGIKGITEDQANLLASYLNAIRADVSYSKTLWVRMDANLQRIADMFTSSPTLMEYQAQIAANTYNTATATQAILGRLIDVIGIGDNGSAIKVVS